MEVYCRMFLGEQAPNVAEPHVVWQPSFNPMPVLTAEDTNWLMDENLEMPRLSPAAVPESMEVFDR